MIRKLILSAVIATATLTGLAAVPARADGGPPALLPHHRFEVVARRGASDWQSKGTFRLHARAELLAVRLRQQGYTVEIRQF
ncbi:hypothetical protein [Frigoriglobus tundricola]|uniref:Uncharacterized protein n=1 Tax=Frigoriglobus tundricola TaxID=2774151 RepID=A0A6M5Z5I6_9BACT|nr:hypothetical protein [Frigoriglobus tundricola]QJX00701.1 hypothetical protein FTUN_8333 [Frigoriglobus tundricola]